MDANRQRLHLLADERDLAFTGDPPALQWDRQGRALRLASGRQPPALTEDAGAARSAVERVPMALDAFGTSARWDAQRQQIVASGVRQDEVAIATLAPDDIVSDLALGQDDVLYVAAAGKVRFVDRRGRFADLIVEAPGLQAWRLAAAPGGGAWVLDRVGRRLGRVRGLPLTPRPGFSPAPDVFRPSPEDPDPPRLEASPGDRLPSLERGQPDELPVALAVGPGGDVAVLCWRDGAEAVVRRRDAEGRWQAALLPGVRFPTALAFVERDRVAVLVPGLAEALAYDLVEGAGRARLAGDRYPLRGPGDGGPFVHAPALPPLYSLGRRTAPLVRISRPSYPLLGSVGGARPFDGGSAHTVWHRLYLEAAIPEGCGIVVRLAGGDDAQQPPPAEAFFAHRFGQVPEDPAAHPDVPRGTWVPDPSEVPFHPGLLGCPAERDRAGLFTALIQRAGRRVRSLRGRFLWVQITLFGDGRTTPELAGLRAYSDRFSYVENYLPALYHPSVFGPAREALDRAAPADFLERFLGLFEGILTPLEDRIGAAYLLTQPETARPESLEWLAGWLGLSLDPGLGVERRRRMIAAGPELYRRRGTRRGLELALDVATGGAVERGEIVVLEDHLLRRTFATILGANLADQQDPLLPGLAASGNSFVGDTLFLGEEERREFLALFRAGLTQGQDEEQAVAELFDRLAWRATVLVHDQVGRQDLGLIQRVVEREAPAHVLTRVLTASTRFLVGLAALVGIDTFLGPREPSGTATVDRSQIGVRDYIHRVPALDPRVDASLSSARPRAVLQGPARANRGAPIPLDGRRSTAGAGHELAGFLWTLVS